MPQPGQREQEKLDEFGKQGGQPVVQGEQAGRDQREIKPPACQGEDHGVQPDQAAAVGRPEEENCGAEQPEQQVQSGAKEGQVDPDPEHPEQVVKQAGGQAQQQCAQEGSGLGGDGYRHLSGAAGTGTRPWGRRLVGQRVDGTLYL